MKLPSLISLFKGLKETLTRFPFALLSAAGCSIIMIILADNSFEHNEINNKLINAAMVFTAGISFFIALKILSESIKASRTITYLIQIAGAIILVLYYISLPNEAGVIEITRFILFLIASHLLVSVSPFLVKKFGENKTEFWNFNYKLFTGILISAVYSAVLFTGLAIAILSFNNLFEANIKPKIYQQLFFFIAGIFNTWFFLSGFPKNEEELKTDLYPKGLKIFTQYILLPLVIIYLLILYLYSGKIIMQWQLPTGWVSYLILSFSITGIFSLLLIDPLKNQDINKWIRVFSKWFYLILFPLLILLFTSILRRTGDYGITERRYFVFVLAVWLTITAIYFTISKTKNIKFIPNSLLITAVLSSFGPWGAFSISERSQLLRFEEILNKNNMIKDGKIIKPANRIAEKEEEDISSIIDFLSERKSLGVIREYYPENIDTIKGREENGIFRKKEAIIAGMMGIEYSHTKFSADTKYFYSSIKNYNQLDIKNFDYVFYFRYNSGENSDKKRIYRTDKGNIEIELNENTNELIINSEGIHKEVINLEKFIDKIKSIKTEPRAEEMMIENGEGDFRYKIVFLNIGAETLNGGMKIRTLNAEVFVGEGDINYENF